jgi:tetratricopeptide (TPR) repeat protein
MIMPIVMLAAVGIAEIVGIILWVVVLIKMFKNEGTLKGILGFFCGIYVFVWGWMKHKQLTMTKTMAVWSVAIVLPLLLIPVMGVSSVMEMQQYVEAYSGDGDAKISKPDSNSNLKKKLLAKKKTRKKALKKAQEKTSKTPATGNVDWSQKAMALWDKDKFKNPKMAVDYWSRAISKNQSTVKAYNNRGIAYHELKQYDKAIKDYSQAIKMDPADVAVYNNRGNAYYEQNKYELALADYNRGLKRRPDYAKAHLNRGLVYYQMGKTDKACRDFLNASDYGEDDGINWAKKNAVCK